MTIIMMMNFPLFNFCHYFRHLVNPLKLSATVLTTVKIRESLMTFFQLKTKYTHVILQNNEYQSCTMKRASTFTRLNQERKQKKRWGGGGRSPIISESVGSV